MTNQNPAHAFASRVYEACDSMDEQRFARFLTIGCTFVYANCAPVTGRDQAAACVKDFMSLIAGIRHELLQVWDVSGTIISRMNVTYTRKDGCKLTVPSSSRRKS